MIVAVFLLTTCEQQTVRQDSQPKVQQEPAKTPEKEVTIESLVPEVILSSETPAIQERSGVKVVVSLDTFKCEIAHEPKSEKIGESPDGRYQYFDDIKEPHLVVTPKIVSFHVTVHNQMSHILRLAGSVISFQMDGKQITLQKEGYKDFMDGIIIPRSAGEYTIQGPPLTALPQGKDQIAIALLIYDVVVETDAAGNATKRENFQWFYTCSLKKVEQKAQLTAERRKVDTTVPCRICNGTGELGQCSQCKGRGGPLFGGTCSACNGSGKIICSQCNGSGRIKGTGF